VIGSLRHQIELYAPSRLADGAGGASLEWTLVETVWAGLERLASTRDFAGDRNNRLRRLAATIRKRTDVDLGARVRFEETLYEIVSVEAGAGDEKTMTLICEEAKQ